MQGKIIKGIAGFYYVYAQNEETYECKAKGIFRNQNMKPLVGDNVELQVLDQEKRQGNIIRILPRMNSLIRPAVANVDQAIIIFALKDPDPNLNLLDRFLIVMAQQGVPVSICFSKLDIAEEASVRKWKSIYESCGYPVCCISTYSGEGMDQLRSWLDGKTTVLAGPSGVGKSSLVNQIKPEAAMETGEISRKIKRGRHTTRHSEFFAVHADTFLLDTPGFSTIYLENITEEELKDYFPEFEPFEGQCRFIGCAHMGEKECGVKDAVRTGKIPASRYENYKLLYQEQKNKRRY